jgi:hypothetical protein
MTVDLNRSKLALKYYGLAHTDSDISGLRWSSIRSAAASSKAWRGRAATLSHPQW